MRILSVDGGGYLGLASATLLAEAERHFGVSCHERFDLFCGTSTGAIIALALASGMSAAEVAVLYRDFGPKVFRNPVPGVRAMRTAWGFVAARYSNRALAAALGDAFGERTLGDVQVGGKRALVTAFCMSAGEPRVFKTDHAVGLTLHDRYRLRDVALASSAAPVYLPNVVIPSPTTGAPERFCDGGVFANHPAVLGYAEAVSHLDVSPTAVRLLSVSTPRASLAEGSSAGGPLDRFLLSRGVLGWSTKISGVMIDGTSKIAHHTLDRLVRPFRAGGARYERIDLERPRGTDLDIATARATAALVHAGSHRATLAETRARLAPFFRD